MRLQWLTSTLQSLLFSKSVLSLFASFFLLVGKGSAEEVSQAKSFAELARLPNVTVSYYEVSGLNREELVGQLRMHGPKDLHNARRDAAVRWDIQWRWPGEAKSALLNQAKVSCEISVTLPKWVNRKSAPTALQRSWESYYRSLLDHEAKHVRMALQIAEEIEREIRSRASLDDEFNYIRANKLGQRYLVKLREMDESYDRRTKNGKKYGVKL